MKIRLRVFDDTEDTYWILIGENLRGYVMYEDLSNYERYKRNIHIQTHQGNTEWSDEISARLTKDVLIIDTHLEILSEDKTVEEAYRCITENYPELFI